LSLFLTLNFHLRFFLRFRWFDFQFFAHRGSDIELLIRSRSWSRLFRPTKSSPPVPFLASLHLLKTSFLFLIFRAGAVMQGVISLKHRAVFFIGDHFPLVLHALFSDPRATPRFHFCIDTEVLFHPRRARIFEFWSQDSPFF